MTKIGAVINRASGVQSPEKREKVLRDIKGKLGQIVEPDNLRIVTGAQVKEEIKRLKRRGVEVLVVGGGDGTISTAAQLLSDSEIRLAVIRLGTRNHFARDLGIPADPLEAIELLTPMRERSIDVGEVNGHLFINNASIGLYPKMLKKREKIIRKKGWKKFPAQISAVFSTLWWLPVNKLSVQEMTPPADSPSVSQRLRSYSLTPLLFVGNNEYQGNILSDSFRPSLQEGKLWFCMVRASGFFSLLNIVWRLNLKGLQKVKTLEVHLVSSATILSGRQSVQIAMDGELHVMAAPLQFRIHKQCLKVLVP